MITPAPNKDLVPVAPMALIGANAPVALPAAPGGTPADAAELDSSDLNILQAVMSHGEPVTLGRLAKLTGLPAADLCGVLETLCRLRLLNRLNTLVPSYTARQ
jgi:hypothetical protein